jgi:hypothetical protein
MRTMRDRMAISRCAIFERPPRSRLTPYKIAFFFFIFLPPLLSGSGVSLFSSSSAFWAARNCSAAFCIVYTRHRAIRKIERQRQPMPMGGNIFVNMRKNCKTTDMRNTVKSAEPSTSSRSEFFRSSYGWYTKCTQHDTPETIVTSTSFSSGPPTGAVPMMPYIKAWKRFTPSQYHARLFRPV